MKNSVVKKCAYCGKYFDKYIPRLKNSKSGLYFCCRKHKDLAQKLKNDFPEIRPIHYGKGYKYNRKQALKIYNYTCEICGYNKIVDILEVHHIDRNHSNNKLINLVILCPNCHKIEHRKK